MSHWAEIDQNNIVLRILVGDNDDPNADEGYQWLLDNLGGTWIKTSYNTRLNQHPEGKPLHKNFAEVGYSWDGVGFAPPSPYSSWILNTSTYSWQAPTPKPEDDKLYAWDEETLSWIKIALPF